MTNGIERMRQEREKISRLGSRRVPPPRHGRASSSSPELDPAPPVNEPAVPGQDSPDPGERSATAVPSVGASSADVESGVKAYTLSLQLAADDWLTDVLFLARRQRLSVVTRSAVVRLAMERLMEQMDPGQVVAELGSRAEGQPRRPGRPRV